MYPYKNFTQLWRPAWWLSSLVCLIALFLLGAKAYDLPKAVANSVQVGSSFLAAAPSNFGGSAYHSDIDGSTRFASDRLTIQLTEVVSPPANRTLNAYLLKDESSTGLLCRDLPVVDGAINTDCDFPGAYLIGRYDTLSFMQESAIFSVTLPSMALAELKKGLYSADDTPSNTGYGIGLKTEAKLLVAHAGFARNSADTGNLYDTKNHTEHILNILYGSADPRFGDVDNNGSAANPGDGYGLLPYRQKLLEVVQAAASMPDSTANIQSRATEVEVALNNIGDGSSDSNTSGWAGLLIERAESLLATNDITEAQALASQMAGIASRISEGAELNDNGQIEPSEGGAQLAWQYTQYAAEFTAPNAGGYIRFSDSDIGENNDSLHLNLSSMPVPETDEQYWIYLLADNDLADNDEWYMAGAVDGANGSVDAVMPSVGRNLAANHYGIMVTVGQKIAEDKQPPLALGYICSVMDTAEGTPGEIGYGVGLAQQARLLANHARFAREAAEGGSLPSAKLHAEHVLNILYGANDSRYDDYDNDGIADNPGDGYGLLPYREMMATTMILAEEAADATDLIRTRAAEVRVSLDNIGDGSGASSSAWSDLLIARAEELVAASDINEVQTLASQLEGLAKSIYEGREQNDNGEIEPIENEGGVLTAYRSAQRSADYFPQALVELPTATPTTADASPTPTVEVSVTLTANVDTNGTETPTSESTVTVVATDTPTLATTPSVTAEAPTNTATPLAATDTPTPTFTTTPTATPTATQAATQIEGTNETTTPTFTPTATPTKTEWNANTDNYEDDNQCMDAKPITTEGFAQPHTFGFSGDTDWVRFDAISDVDYKIEVTIPEDSRADVAMELYIDCTGLPFETWDQLFTRGASLNYSSPVAETVYMKMTNHNPEDAGMDVSYNLAVRALEEGDSGLLIVVAGAIKNNDPVQPNIYFVTDAVRQLFLDKGATDDEIYYLSPDLSRDGVDASATAANLEAAITQWANEKSETAQSLTLYLMDHGDRDLFYLDKQRGELLRPGDLDQWLTQLEVARPALRINVIYEACYSGSFVSGDESISKPGRVVISSTDDVNLAWASSKGAVFSDHLLDSMRNGRSLSSSFHDAQIAAQIAHPQQQPWIDGDGDGDGTDDASLTVAAQRGFDFAGSLDGESWPPLISEVQPIEPDENGRAVIRALVRDDIEVDNVWAVIYPPSYNAPTVGEELVQEELDEVLASVNLLSQSDDWYGTRYDNFTENGIYRIVVYADDNQDLDARPVSIEIRVGNNDVYIPLRQ